jgi:hypothetical protein
MVSYGLYREDRDIRSVEMEDGFIEEQLQELFKKG